MEKRWTNSIMCTLYFVILYASPSQHMLQSDLVASKLLKTICDNLLSLSQQKKIQVLDSAISPQLLCVHLPFKKISILICNGAKINQSINHLLLLRDLFKRPHDCINICINAILFFWHITTSYNILLQLLWKLRKMRFGNFHLLHQPRLWMVNMCKGNTWHA